MLTTRVCCLCEVEKDVDCFRKDPRNKTYGVIPTCKDCEKNKRDKKKIDIEKLKKNDTFMNTTMKICKVCKEEKCIKHFRIASVNSDGFFNTCKTCEAVHYNQKSLTFRPHILSLLSTAHASAQHRKERGREEAGNMTIDFDYAENLWKKQDGLCFYSNLLLKYDTRDWRASLERLNPEKGYTPDNVVFVCGEFNDNNQWSHEKILYMIDVLDNPNKYKISPESVIPGSLMYKQLQRLICRSKDRDTKFRKYNKPKDGEYNVNIDFLVELYQKQDGLCAISGMPLQYGTVSSHNWIASLDRIQQNITYTKENVQLVCGEFNTMDNSVKVTLDETYTGSTGWTKTKFQMFLDNYKSKKPWEKANRLLIDIGAKKENDSDDNLEKQMDRLQINQNPTTTCVTCKQQFVFGNNGSIVNICDDCIKDKRENAIDFYENHKDSMRKKCTSCQQEKYLRDFTRNSDTKMGENSCKDCRSLQKKQSRTSNLKSAFLGLLGNARKTSRTSQKESLRNFNLTFDDLFMIWQEQDGKCSLISTDDLSLQGENCVSLRRIDINKGFNKDNVCLICLKNARLFKPQSL